MEYLLLVLAASGTTFQNFMSKNFNTKESMINPYFYSATSAFMAMVFFVLSSGFKLNFVTEFLPYSVAFGIAYGSASYGMVNALRHGPLALSSLILSLSLIIPTLFGIIVLKDPIGIFIYLGIALLLIALVLINIKKEGDMKLSFKWIIFIVITFIGNGACSTVQKMQQLAFDGGYKSEFMIVALTIVWVSLFLLGLGKQGSKKQMLISCSKYAVPAGLANGFVNLLVMVLSGMLPNAILFPSISAGGMVLTFILALTFLKERLSKMQTVGYVAGILSVILLNL